MKTKGTLKLKRRPQKAPAVSTDPRSEVAAPATPAKPPTERRLAKKAKAEKPAKLVVPEGVRPSKADLLDWVKRYADANATRGGWGRFPQFTEEQVVKAMRNAATPWGAIMSVQHVLGLKSAVSVVQESNAFGEAAP